jgi:hypothetical protein
MLAQEEARRLGHNFVGTEQVRGRASRPSLRTAPSTVTSGNRSRF